MIYYQYGSLIGISAIILGLKYLASPRTAVWANMLSALGMLLIVVLTIMQVSWGGWPLLVTGLVIGSAIGTWLALRVQMTQMPELVALFNGLGGAASGLVGLSEVIIGPEASMGVSTIFNSAAAFCGIIGWLTFSGSLIAVLKLMGRWKFRLSNISQRLLLGLNIVFVLFFLSLFMFTHGVVFWYLCISLSALCLGLVLVMPIGGADMPVVVSLLNSVSGLAAAGAGFVVSSHVLIIGGALVGAAGLILTNIMCRAMNRRLFSVLFVPYGEITGVQVKRQKQGSDVVEVAMMLEAVRNVIFVPGYGMAVAQAQHVVKELAVLLKSRGVSVKYAIHPVAGRMPGHMNVLLAEAQVSYEDLYECDVINPEFADCDLVIVVGANDTINPAARGKQGPLAGMPILDVDKARQVVIIKRSLAPGYAGVDNDLFYEDKTMMLFGDAKQQLMALVRECQS